jgi:hypothetical protein
MRNVTISFLNNADSTVDAVVTSFVYKTSYVFQSPRRLVIAYAVALVGFFPFIIVGLAAMLHNGVSASHGGFLQILCTTTASASIVNHLSRKACLGGEENLSSELLDLEVQFGTMQDEHGLKFAAFGTKEEVAKIRNEELNYS